MNKLDDYLIDDVFQGIVNKAAENNTPRVKLIKALEILYHAFILIAFSLQVVQNGFAYWSIILFSIMCLIAFFHAYLDYKKDDDFSYNTVLNRFLLKRIRRNYAIILLVNLYMSVICWLFVEGPTWWDWVASFSFFLKCCAEYFCACRDVPPKKREQKERKSLFDVFQVWQPEGA